jgi:asparagine synthase (glutamine-hydrolysing)
MCGIAGAFAPRDMLAEVRRMTDAVAHRGPDDAGVAALRARDGEPCGAFGHRRLSILDLSSAGHQPMTTSSGRFTLVFNGEIYNFLPLRAELEAEGIEFRSGSDTEVLLLGLAAHGQSFLRRLRGMFAFAFWDAEERRGLLVRDPFGIKPLYIAETDGAVLFASELRAVLASGRVPAVLNREAMMSFLATGSVAEPISMIAGIRALPAGTLVEIAIRDGRAVVGAETLYRESPLDAAEEQITSGPSAARRVREALRDSMDHHLVSDVPVGFFLSGGIDSSALVGIGSELSSSALNTFTVTFAEQEYSEAGPARAVAERFGTRHQEILLSGRDLLSALPAMFSRMDQPSIDGLNSYVVSRAVREHGIKVVLSGLGGDELFGGYPSFRRAKRLRNVWPALAPFRRSLAWFASLRSDLRAGKLREMVMGGSPALGACLASRMLFSDSQVSDLLGGSPTVARPDAPATLSLLQQVTWYEATAYMRNTLLRDGDTFSMAHGLELRVPFVDLEVARAAMSIDDRLKLAPGHSKPVLVAAVRDLLPREVWDRPKQGFTLPLDRWMRVELHQEIEAIFNSPWVDALGMDAQALRRTWTQFQTRSGGITWSRPWALYTLLRWARDNDAVLEDPVDRRRSAGATTGRARASTRANA